MAIRLISKTTRRLWQLRDDLALLKSAREAHFIDLGSGIQRAVNYVFGADVEGDFIEFGTGTGFTASVIARTMAELNFAPSRKLWLFDSFEGLPEATSETDRMNPHVATGVWGAGSCRGLTAEDLHTQVSRFLDPARIRIEKGWFADTMKNVADDARFGFVHVDGDLYQSTIDCLSPLFARKLLSPGAVIVFDDWNCGRADNALGERRAWREITEKHQADFEDFGHRVWSGHSFILHSYR